MTTFGESLIKSAYQALAIAKGEAEPAGIYIPEAADKAQLAGLRLPASVDEAEPGIYHLAEAAHGAEPATIYRTPEAAGEAESAPAVAEGRSR